MMGAGIADFRAGRIVALDFSDWRLRRARELGATDAINPAHHNAVEVLREINAGRLADCVVVTAPTTAAWQSGFALVENGGTFQDATLALLSGERLAVDRLITRRFPMEQIQAAVDLLLADDESLKSVILPEG